MAAGFHLRGHALHAGLTRWSYQRAACAICTQRRGSPVLQARCAFIDSVVAAMFVFPASCAQS